MLASMAGVSPANDAGGHSGQPAATITNSSNSTCIPLYPKSRADQDASILVSGQYCVVQNFNQPKLSGAGHSGPAYDHALIEIRGGDVFVDLQGHTLSSGFRSSGILSYSLANRGYAKREPQIFGLETRRIVVRNGTIDLRSKGTGAGVRLIKWWSLDNLDESVPRRVEKYEPTQFILENLLIKTSSVGIQLEGDGNIVRNCKIESSGNAAIIMAGPNSQIVNNDIILKEPFMPTELANEGDWLFLLPRLADARKRTRAVIALRQGSGSVISGNKIEIEGASPTRHAIFIRDGSEAVRVEDNIFIGTDKPVTLSERSVAELRNNTLRESRR
jgi:hypothetical protein